MSSPTERRIDWQGWGLLALSLVATIWYAQGQLVFSLLFLYRLVQYGLAG